MRPIRRPIRTPGSYIALPIRYPASRALAREIARRLELELGLRVEPLARSRRRHANCDLRVEGGPLTGRTLRRAHRTIEAFRPTASRAPATD